MKFHPDLFSALRADTDEVVDVASAYRVRDEAIARALALLANCADAEIAKLATELQRAIPAHIHDACELREQSLGAL